MRDADHAELKLASECAQAIHSLSGIGCLVSDAQGRTLYDCGYSAAQCKLCALAGRDEELCARTHAFGANEAERFGNTYIYLCPLGLSCLSSPIVGKGQNEAKLTVGPFLMVEKQDYIACDLSEHAGMRADVLLKLMDELENIAFVAPSRVTNLSTLMYMSTGFLNNVSDAKLMLEQRETAQTQNEISEYIHHFKREELAPPYPIETEQALLTAMKNVDRPEARRLMNELLGYFLFSSGDIERMKSQIFSLLVLISRTAIACGSDPEQLLEDNRKHYSELTQIGDLDRLCLWLKRVTNAVMDSIFRFEGVLHGNVVHRSILYIDKHYREHITLSDIARNVYLSPSYFSRLFKQDMGESVTAYLNRIRIERSKKLLQDKGIRLTDIAQQVGFEDHSYFTKVFKRIVGTTPIRYRERLHSQ